MDVAKRLGHLSVGYDLRSADLGALMSMLSFSAVLWDPCQVSDARRQRALVNMLAGGKQNTRRCLEVCLGLLSPIYTGHPFLKHWFMSKSVFSATC